MRVPAERITQICNGVDGERFRPHAAGVQRIAGCPFDPSQYWLVGSVGRMQDIKDPLLLARAFVLVLALQPALQQRLRLVMVGAGPLHAQVQTLLAQAGVLHLAWLPGERLDVPDLLRGLHAFVLPSRSEGISNAILEAMASALPVLATRVGGNPELVRHGQTGYLVPADAPQSLAQRLLQLAQDPGLARVMGRAGRVRMERCFSLASMVSAYQALYDWQLQRAGRRMAGI